MNNKLNKSHFSFICPMSWEGMAPSANGRFCEQCRREVFDLTDCSLEEVAALQQKHGPLCGSIRVVQTAAVVALTLSAAACRSETGVHSHLPRPIDSKGGMASGMILLPPNIVPNGTGE